VTNDRPSSVSRWIALFVLSLAVPAFAQTSPSRKGPAKINQADQTKIANQVLTETADGQQTTFIVYLTDQADVSLAYTIKDPDARGWYVYQTLRDHAAATQAPIKETLDAAGVQYTSFWAANMIVVAGGRDLVESMAIRSDVSAIEPNSVIDGVKGEDAPESTDEGNETEAIEVGLNNVQAPPLWNFGFKGAGIVIANQDTGMRWTHRALQSHYRGWNGSVADHNYNWHDSVHARITTSDGGTGSPATNSCGYNLMLPCDDQGHGTHTTGTTVGWDNVAPGTGVNQIGVAPDAKWIGCRNMDAGNGRAATYTECFQWFLAPTNLAGANADPTKRPHVMNNSWGCPQAGELCAPNVMKTIVENSEAAGIFVEVSAGNDGPSCNTVKDPPAIYLAAFATGAISGAVTSAGTSALQSFSSRGPVTVDGSNKMKPDLSAPGANVRSSLRTTDTSYGNMSGTSMAGPHVVRTVALLWSARPKLVRDVPRTKWVLTRAANPGVTVASNSAGCGGIGDIPNNHFGWGRVDVLAAYNLEPSLDQVITFDSISNKLLSDADFAVNGVATSNLPVRFAATGSCSVSGNSVHIASIGDCTVVASQEGLDEYGIAKTSPKPWYPADNVSHVFHVFYPYSGFLTPISNTGANVVQAGSGVPIKFALGGDQGMAILADGYPKSQSVSCATGAPAAAPDTASPAGRSGLQYDTLLGQYTYVWKTDKAWAGTCRVVQVKLADDSMHTATFQFKK